MPGDTLLVITAPAYTGVYSGFNLAWPKIQQAFMTHVPAKGNHDIYATFLSSGQPFHLPLGFSKSEAEQFAGELRNADCDVTVVASS